MVRGGYFNYIHTDIWATEDNDLTAAMEKLESANLPQIHAASHLAQV
jgi:hypothetical protein